MDTLPIGKLLTVSKSDSKILGNLAHTFVTFDSFSLRDHSTAQTTCIETSPFSTPAFLSPALTTVDSREIRMNRFKLVSNK